MVIWITGLSASGKTTLASAVTEWLRQHYSGVVMIDGDIMRTVLGGSTAYNREDRLNIGLQYSRMSKMLSDQGIITVVATISMFEEVHRSNRKQINPYYDIYLRVPLDELKNRDPKGLYSRYESGLIKNVSGLDVPVDEPPKPALTIDHYPGLTADKVFSLVKPHLLKWMRAYFDQHADQTNTN